MSTLRNAHLLLGERESGKLNFKQGKSLLKLIPIYYLRLPTCPLDSRYSPIN
jgi:hypothetical protein